MIRFGGLSKVRNGEVVLRLAHPGLYLLLSSTAVWMALLAENFLRRTPAFDPLGVSKTTSGIVFLVVALIKLYYLNVPRPSKRLRLATTLSFATFLAYGGLQAGAYFDLGQTSLQSPYLYFALATVELIGLLEPTINPAHPAANVNGVDK